MTASDAPGEAARLTPLALPAISACYFALGVNMLAPVGLVPQMAREFGVSTGAIAYLLTASALAYALSAPVLQMLFGARDRRTLIIYGLWMAGVGSLICAAAPVFAAAIAGRMLMGMGFALIGPMATAMAASIVPAKRAGQAIGIALMGMTVSTVLGVPLVTFLGAAVGWRLAMVTASAVCVLVIVLLRFQAPAGSRGVRTTPLAMLGVLKDPVIAPALLAPYFLFAALYATHAMIVVFLVQRYGMPTTLIPAALWVLGVSGVLGSILITWLQGRARADTLIPIALAALCFMFFMLFVAPPIPAVTFVLLAFWGVAGSTGPPAMSSRLVALAGDGRNMVLALNAALLQCGIASGAAIAGIVYDHAGPRFLPLASVGLLTCSALAYVVSRLSAKRRAEAAAAPA
ncbi:MFS transporter [Phenylobacterium sp.]|uniref:MFS transporter n=1 Tax=Phenylobacterium sp. TaxID=1871053 RepID=UPI002733B123|nr:MFS transporter [Phenylobacterium sp.]MDP3659928.1 MFS transporter [Phenylobacterium sp.]